MNSFRNLRHRNKGHPKEKFQSFQCVCSFAAGFVENSLTIILPEFDNASSRIRSLLSYFVHSPQEEERPSFPISRIPYGLKPIIVLASIALEKNGEIQKRALEYLSLAENECDQETSDPAITVQKRMDGFKLGMEIP